MSEIENLVLPILQKIQGDLSALRAKADDIAESQLGHGEKLEEIERYMTLHMGVTMQNKLNVDDMLNSIRTLEQRVSVLESRS